MLIADNYDSRLRFAVNCSIPRVTVYYNNDLTLAAGDGLGGINFHHVIVSAKLELLQLSMSITSSTSTEV